LLEITANIRENNNVSEGFPGCPETCNELWESTAVEFQRGSSGPKKFSRWGNEHTAVV